MPDPAYSAQGPVGAPGAASAPAPVQRAAPPGKGLSPGSLSVTIPLALIGLVMLGSTAFIGFVVLNIQDNQIPLLAVGFVALGASFAALAIASLVGMWRAASRARGGRAFALAIVGGLAGLGAIGAFTVTALLAMVWSS